MHVLKLTIDDIYVASKFCSWNFLSLLINVSILAKKSIFYFTIICTLGL